MATNTKTPNNQGWTAKRKEKAKKIILKHAGCGKSVNWMIKNDENVPNSRETVYRWMSEGTGEFGKKYRNAKRVGIEVIVDSIMIICDETVEKAKKNEASNAYIQAQRLKVDTLKWYAAKLTPRLYAERTIEDENNQKEEPKEIAIRFD